MMKKFMVFLFALIIGSENGELVIMGTDFMKYRDSSPNESLFQLTISGGGAGTGDRHNQLQLNSSFSSGHL